MPTRTPYTCFDGDDSLVASKGALLAMSRAVEARCLVQGGEGSLVVATMQHLRHLSPLTAAMYYRLRLKGAHVVLLGVHMEQGADRVPGAELVNLGEDSPLVEEWTVVVVSRAAGFGFSARDLCDAAHPDFERRFTYRTTEDRDAALHAVARLSALVPGSSLPRPWAA